MSTAPLKNVSVPSRPSVMRMVDGFGSAVLPQPYHMQAMPTPRRRRGDFGVVRGDAGQRRVPIRLQCVQALRQAGGVRQDLSRRRGVAMVERVDAPDGPAVEPQPLGQVVHQRLVRDGGLRNAEAAEGAGGRVVGVDGARAHACVGHLVGSHAVHGHAVRHRRSPRGVGAGVEIGLHLEGREPALRVGGRLGPDARRMPLGGGGHRLRARVDDAHGAPGHPRRHRQQRLHRHVELAAEAAAARRRADAHARAVDAQHARRLLQVHVRRLGAGRDLDAVGAMIGPPRWARHSRPPARCRRARRTGSRSDPQRSRLRRHVRPGRRRDCRLPRVSTLSGEPAWIAGVAGASAVVDAMRRVFAASR